MIILHEEDNKIYVNENEIQEEIIALINKADKGLTFV
jgi:hypothetical protein